MNVEIIPKADHGSTDSDLPGYEYLHITLITSDDEGTITGWFKPATVAFIREALTKYAADQYDGAPTDDGRQWPQAANE